MKHSKSGPSTGPAKSIVDTAVAAGKFTKFVAGLNAAGMIEVLSRKGPFTVFAPTDKALNKLPAGTYGTLLRNTAKPEEVLNYGLSWAASWPKT
jgi:uncharacterized surface protein with fasciclin (FAS1) repeats